MGNKENQELLNADLPESEIPKKKHKRNILLILLWFILTLVFLFQGLVLIGLLDEIGFLEPIVTPIIDFADTIVIRNDVMAYAFFVLTGISFVLLLLAFVGKKRKVIEDSKRNEHVVAFFRAKKKKKWLVFWFIMFLIFGGLSALALLGDRFLPDNIWESYADFVNGIITEGTDIVAYSLLALSALFLLIFLVLLFKRSGTKSSIKSSPQYQEIIAQDRNILFQNACEKYGVDKDTLARFQPIFVCNPTNFEELKKSPLIKTDETGKVLYSLENFQVIFFDTKKIYFYSAIVDHAKNHIYKEEFANFLVKNIVGVSTKISTQTLTNGYKEVLDLIFTFSNGLHHKMVIKNRLSRGVVDSKDLLTSKETEILNQLYTLIKV